MVTIIEWIQLLCLSISFPLYILFLITLFKYRHIQPFNSEFFTLCRNLGICDLLSLANSWILFKFPSFGWLGLPKLVQIYPVFAKIAIMLSWQFVLTQYLGVLSLAVNRFTGLVTPLRHPLIWTKTFLNFIIFVQWVLPAIAISPQLNLPFAYKMDNITGQLSKPIWLDHEMQSIYFTCVSIFIGSVTLVTLVLYVVTYVNTHKRVQDEAVTISRHDIILAIYGFCISVVMFLCVLYTLLRAVMPKGDVHMWNLLILMYGVCNDVFSWCNPWLCLILLKTVRKHMKTTLFCKQNYVAPSTPQHVVAVINRVNVL